MKNPSPLNNNFQIDKERAKLFYDQIGTVWCPAIRDYVICNRIGFQHLIRKGKVLRSQNEQKSRLALVRYIEPILRSFTAFVVEEEREILHQTKIDSKYLSTLSRAHFWRLTEECDGLVIKLVIRQIKDNKKHFFSIFVKKQKVAQQVY